MHDTPSEHLGSTVPLYGAGASGLGGGGGQTQDHQSPRIIVGNAPAGDTTYVCDFLDPGDGSGIAAALAAAGALAALLNPPGTPTSATILVDVRLRAGRYVFVDTLDLPENVRLIGAGERQTMIVPPDGTGGIHPWCAFVTDGPNVTVERMGFMLPALAEDALYAAGYRGVIAVSEADFTGRELLLVPDSDATYNIDAASLARSLVHVTIADPGLFLLEQVIIDFSSIPANRFIGGLCALALATFGEFSLTYDTTAPRSARYATIRNVQVYGLYEIGSVRFDGVAGFTCVTVEIDGYRGTNVVAPATFLAAARTQDVSVLGPRIRNLDNVYPRGVAEFTAGIVVTCVDAGFACTMVDLLFSDVTGKYADQLAHPTTILHPQINASNDNCIILGVQVSSMQLLDASGSPCEAQIGSAGTGTISNFSAARLRLDSPVGNIVIGANTGTVRNTQITNALCNDLSVLASSANAQILACRITGAYSDAGAGTSVSINIIGP